MFHTAVLTCVFPTFSTFSDILHSSFYFYPPFLVHRFILSTEVVPGREMGKSLWDNEWINLHNTSGSYQGEKWIL